MTFQLGRRILVRERGSLITLAAGVPGTTIDSGTWRHQGPANGVSDITLLNGGRFDAPVLDLRNARLRADTGGAFDIADLRTSSSVTIRGGGQLRNQTASIGFADAIVDGTASTWTVQDLLEVPAAARIIATNRAAIVVREVRFSDPAGFAFLVAQGTDSRVTVQTPLVLLQGNVRAYDGGHFTVPRVTVGAARSITVGRGSQGLGGAQFDCAGEITLGTNGAGFMDVTGGGRAMAQSVRIGFSPTQSTLRVDATGGTARFEVADHIQVGEQGTGSLQVRNGGRLEFVQPGGMIVVTPDPNGNGDVSVEGADSLLDLGTGALHVGRSGPGRLNVTAGGTLTGANLNIGDSSGPATRTALVTGAGSSVRLRQGSAYVGTGSLRVVNGGFMQITSEVLEGSLTLEANGVVDVVGGSLEIGNGGGAPTSVLRVDRGLLRGGGTVRANSVEVIAQGRCRPGLSLENSHVLRIQGGSYLQDANGTLEIDVLGTAATPLILQLQVDRSVTLNGHLIVNFLGDPPRAGDQIGFLRYGEGLTGSFASVEIRGLTPDVRFEQRILSPGVYGLAFQSNGTTAPCNDPLPWIETIDLSVPGQVVLTVQAGLCGIHRLEVSPDLRTWRELRSFSGDASGVVVIHAQRSGPELASYYRVARW